MSIKLRIKAENEHELVRVLMRMAVPFLEQAVEDSDEGEPFSEPKPEPPPTAAAPEPASAPEPPKQGRPKGSKNKPKANGGEPQPEPQTQAGTNGAGEPLSLAEQIQIITDAAHDQPERFKPLLAPLRDKLGVQYVSKAGEKDRPVLQEFINEHGLAV